MSGILFLCIHNAGRSQMAAGFARELSNGDVVILSGGSEPAATVNPVAVDVMNEKFHPVIDEMVGKELKELKEKLPPRLDFEAIGMRRLLGTRTDEVGVPR